MLNGRQGIGPPDGWKDESVEFKDSLIEMAFTTVNHFLAVIVDAAEHGHTLSQDVVAATAMIFGGDDNAQHQN